MLLTVTVASRDLFTSQSRLLLLALLLASALAEGQQVMGPPGVLQLQIEGLYNPHGRDAGGRCCALPGNSSAAAAACPGPCRTFFRVCAARVGPNWPEEPDLRQHTLACPIGLLVTPAIANNSLDPQRDGILLMRFPYREWPGKLKLTLEAWHDVSGEIFSQQLEEATRSDEMEEGVARLILRVERRHRLTLGEDWLRRSVHFSVPKGEPARRPGRRISITYALRLVPPAPSSDLPSTTPVYTTTTSTTTPPPPPPPPPSYPVLPAGFLPSYLGPKLPPAAQSILENTLSTATTERPTTYPPFTTTQRVGLTEAPYTGPQEWSEVPTINPPEPRPTSMAPEEEITTEGYTLVETITPGKTTIQYPDISTIIDERVPAKTETPATTMAPVTTTGDVSKEYVEITITAKPTEAAETVPFTVLSGNTVAYTVEAADTVPYTAEAANTISYTTAGSERPARLPVTEQELTTASSAESTESGEQEPSFSEDTSIPTIINNILMNSTVGVVAKHNELRIPAL